MVFRGTGGTFQENPIDTLAYGETLQRLAIRLGLSYYIELDWGRKSHFDGTFGLRTDISASFSNFVLLC